MNKYLFKSPPDSDLYKISINKLDMLLDEQRHQRADLAIILRICNQIIHNKDLQKQVDDYFEDDKDIPEEES